MPEPIVLPRPVIGPLMFIFLLFLGVCFTAAGSLYIAWLILRWIA